MRRFVLTMATTLTALGSASALARAQDARAAQPGGDTLFKTYCGSCHGKTGKGDGPLAKALRVPPPDLTLLAKRADGEFAADDVRRIIDGRKPLGGHGGGDMPVWGDAFREAVGAGGEEAVRERIDNVVRFLEGVQVR